MNTNTQYLLSIEKLMSRLQAENKFKIGLSGAPDATLVIQRSIGSRQ
jgi:hypothetical protein